MPTFKLYLEGDHSSPIAVSTTLLFLSMTSVEVFHFVCIRIICYLNQSIDLKIRLDFVLKGSQFGLLFSNIRINVARNHKCGTKLEPVMNGFTEHEGQVKSMWRHHQMRLDLSQYNQLSHFLIEIRISPEICNSTNIWK